MAWMGILGAPGCFRKDLKCQVSDHVQVVREVPKNSSRHISTSSDCDHEIWLEVIEDPGCRHLA